jgi:hypothetical protein
LSCPNSFIESDITEICTNASISSGVGVRLLVGSLTCYGLMKQTTKTPKYTRRHKARSTTPEYSEEKKMEEH